jgi:hypothetical protein
MKISLTFLAAWCALNTAAFAARPDDGLVLPFPPAPLASVANLAQSRAAAAQLAKHQQTETITYCSLCFLRSLLFSRTVVQ